jgi:hypothetical protein
MHNGTTDAVTDPTRTDVIRALRLLSAFANTPTGFAILQSSGAPIVILAAVERVTAEMDREAA